MSHLRAEKSPYLLQHLENPVAWYPWGEIAFARARRENKLIFLSIGYSTCHWCHVMAHESFEDDEVADLLNKDYIAIKVDREERPDIDSVYMEVCQRLTNSGGWPLTIIMTPDAEPFYAATYIPKQGRHGRPGLLNLLPWISEKWQEDPGFLNKAAQEIVAEMQEERGRGRAAKIGLDLHAEARAMLLKNFDRQYGGFGRAPKFPRPHDLVFLLQQFRLTASRPCLDCVELTLRHMLYGGIYDQLGFGFHRYSTDQKWLVPHFEKMLYDQAGLILAYLEAWQLTGHEIYATTAREVLTYLFRDMTSEQGAFFSAEDADSEGEEGVFYIWDSQSIHDILGDRAEAFCQAYNVKQGGNYHDEVSGQKTGMNILHLGPDEDPETFRQMFSEDRAALFNERLKRIRPHLDDKVIAGWNGMMISALADAGRVLEEDDYINRAGRAAEFILKNMGDGTGRLLRRYRQGEAAIPAFAEDYACMARGLLDLYAADFDAKWLRHAVTMAQVLIDQFQEQETGRLFDVPLDGEKLLIRPASTFDGAMPAAGSVTLEVFARLFLLTGTLQWREAGDKLMQSMAAEITRYPAGYTDFLRSSNWLLRPAREVVIVGVPGDSCTLEMLRLVRHERHLQTVMLFKPDPDHDEIVSLAPFVADMQMVNNHATAYLCQDFACQRPVTSVAELSALLDSTKN